jgi:hypothetical protein
VPSKDLKDDTDFEKHIGQYHCGNIKKLNIGKMCTSIAFGFYLRDEEQFIEFREKMVALSLLDDCIFSVQDKNPNYLLKNKENENNGNGQE